MENDIQNYLPTVMLHGTPCTLYSFLRLVYTVLHVAFSSSVYSTSGIGLPLKYKHFYRDVFKGGGAINGSAPHPPPDLWNFLFPVFFKSPWVLSPPIENWSRGTMNDSAVYWFPLIAGPKIGNCCLEYLNMQDKK